MCLMGCRHGCTGCNPLQVLGWPCGQRLRTGGTTFHKWQLPLPEAEAKRLELPFMAGSKLEEEAVEHQLDCVSEGAALDGEGEGEGEGGGRAVARAKARASVRASAKAKATR